MVVLKMQDLNGAELGLLRYSVHLFFFSFWFSFCLDNFPESCRGEVGRERLESWQKGLRICGVVKSPEVEIRPIWDPAGDPGARLSASQGSVPQQENRVS